jgi:hypothetical protein
MMTADVRQCRKCWYYSSSMTRICLNCGASDFSVVPAAEAKMCVPVIDEVTGLHYPTKSFKHGSYNICAECDSSIFCASTGPVGCENVGCEEPRQSALSGKKSPPEEYCSLKERCWCDNNECALSGTKSHAEQAKAEGMTWLRAIVILVVYIPTLLAILHFLICKP